MPLHFFIFFFFFFSSSLFSFFPAFFFLFFSSWSSKEQWWQRGASRHGGRLVRGGWVLGGSRGSNEVQQLGSFGDTVELLWWRCKEEHGLTAKSIELGTGPWQQ
jgi:hypothetical protein